MSDTAIFYLLLTGCAMVFALAFQVRSSVWRGLMTMISAALPWVFVWRNPPVGEFAELIYLIVGGGLILALVVGGVLGFAMKGWHRQKSVGVIIGLAAAFAAFQLWWQYVPETCDRIDVSIGGEVLSLPAALRPRLERIGFVGHFGRADNKEDYAQLCRESRKGTAVIPMETVWVNPVSAAIRMTPLCQSKAAPDWCAAYNPDAFRRIRKIIISSDPERTAPYYFRTTNGSLDIRRDGDLKMGSLCLQSRETTCWAWESFGTEGYRLMIETNNLDPIFDGMAAADARTFLVPARDVFLDIVQR